MGRARSAAPIPFVMQPRGIRRGAADPAPRIPATPGEGYQSGSSFTVETWALTTFQPRSGRRTQVWL